MLLIANFSGPCPECSLTRIMFLESTWHQMDKQRKEAAFMHHQGFIYEELHSPPPKKIHEQMYTSLLSSLLACPQLT